jgi:hypothetical protein
MYDCEDSTTNKLGDTVPTNHTTDPIPGPYPDCEIPCGVQITNVVDTGNGVNVFNTITESPVYTCS